jgi:hypothetical protein
MAYPQPGAVGVLGVVAYCNFVPETGAYVGKVQAYASIYGTPAAYTPDPNSFSFTSATAFTPGAAVSFSVVAGENAPHATNVQLV